MGRLGGRMSLVLGSDRQWRNLRNDHYCATSLPRLAPRAAPRNVHGCLVNFRCAGPIYIAHGVPRGHGNSVATDRHQAS